MDEPAGDIVTAESHSGDDPYVYREVCALKPQEQHVYMVPTALQPVEPWSESPAGERSLEGEIRSSLGQVSYPLQHGTAGRDRDRVRPESRWCW